MADNTNEVETPEVDPNQTQEDPGQDGQETPEGGDANPGGDQLIAVTINGQPRKVTLAVAQRLAQQGYEVRETLQKVQSEAAQAKALLDRLKEDPASVLAELGVDDVDGFMTKALAKRLQDKIDDTLLTPEQKELKALKAEKAAQDAKKKADEEKSKKEKEEKDLEAQYEVRIKEYDDKFKEVIETHALPRSRAVIERMALIELDHAKKGQTIPPAILAQMVKEDFLVEQELAFEGLEGDSLLKAAPKLAEKFRKAELARVQKGGHVPAPVRNPKPKEQPKKKVQPLGSFDSAWDDVLYGKK